MTFSASATSISLMYFANRSRSASFRRRVPARALSAQHAPKFSHAGGGESRVRWYETFGVLVDQCAPGTAEVPNLRAPFALNPNRHAGVANPTMWALWVRR